MSLLSNGTATTETPAKEGGTPDPKAGGAGTGAGADTTSTRDAGSAPTAEGASRPDGTAATAGTASPSKAQQDFEAKLEELATLDLSVKEQAKEIAKAKAKLDRYTPLDEHLDKGEIRAAVKKFLGEKYTADLLLELADDFAPEEISVEERVKRTLAEETKKAEEAAQKKKDEKAAADKAAVETETKAYLTATADHLRKNKDKYPLIVAWDDDPDIDHEAIIDKIWRDHFAKTGEVLDPDKVLEQVEARHLARIKKTSFGPKEQREPTLEEIAGNTPPADPPPRPLSEPAARPQTGADEALARLEAYDKEQKQRALLSYGR